MGSFLLTLLAGVAAGAFTARAVARREIAALRAELVPPPPPEPVPELPPEILMVLSAAVAAFCGKTARIRHARLAAPPRPGSAWAQQGRLFVQASHNLPHRS